MGIAVFVLRNWKPVLVKLSAEVERALASNQKGLGIFVAGHRHIQIKIEVTKREWQLSNPEKAKEW